MPSIIQVDARDMKGSGPIRALARAYRRAKIGDVLELLSTECGIKAASSKWCAKTGNKTLRVDVDRGGVYVVAIQVNKRIR